MMTSSIDIFLWNPVTNLFAFLYPLTLLRYLIDFFLNFVNNKDQIGLIWQLKIYVNTKTNSHEISNIIDQPKQFVSIMENTPVCKQQRTRLHIHSVWSRPLSIYYSTVSKTPNSTMCILIIFFLISPWNYILSVLWRASPRGFLWVPTTYV